MLFEKYQSFIYLMWRRKDANGEFLRERKNFSCSIALSSGKRCSSQLRLWNNSIWLKDLSFRLQYNFIWINRHLHFLLWRKNMVILEKCLGLWCFMVCVVVGCFFLATSQYLTCNISHGNVSNIALWRLLMLNLVTFQTFFKLCLLIHIFVGYSTNNKTESTTLHLHSLTSSIALKYKVLWTAWKEFLQSACILLSEVYFHKVDDTQFTNVDLHTTHVTKLYFI